MARQPPQSFAVRAWPTRQPLVNGLKPSCYLQGASAVVAMRSRNVTQATQYNAAGPNLGVTQRGQFLFTRCAIVCNAAGMPDMRVTSAVAHWAPRFFANGVDPSDFTRVTAAIGGWDGWCAAWSAAAAEHERLGRTALGSGRTLSGGAHLARAAVYYHFAKFMFVQDIPQMRAAHQAAVSCLNDALPYLDPPGERVCVPFDGTELAGILRRPAGDGPHPVVILIAGLDSAKEEFGATEEFFLGDPRRRHHRYGRGPARHRPGEDRRLGRQPRRLLRRPAGQRRRSGACLHRAVRAV